MRVDNGRSRRGAALMMALVTLALLVIVFSSLVRLGFSERGQARAEERRLKAIWLAESGLERAWTKLMKSADYRGETWEIDAKSLGGRDPAVIQITVEPIDGSLRVTSRADYPREGVSRVRQTRVADFPRSNLKQGEQR